MGPTGRTTPVSNPPLWGYRKGFGLNGVIVESHRSMGEGSRGTGCGVDRRRTLSARERFRGRGSEGGVHLRDRDRQDTGLFEERTPREDGTLSRTVEGRRRFRKEKLVFSSR